MFEYIFKFGDISYAEIRNWSLLTGTPLTAWEVETMYTLRSTYETAKSELTKENSLAPYATDKRIDATVDAQFESLWNAAE